MSGTSQSGDWNPSAVRPDFRYFALSSFGTAAGAVWNVRQSRVMGGVSWFGLRRVFSGQSRRLPAPDERGPLAGVDGHVLLVEGDVLERDGSRGGVGHQGVCVEHAREAVDCVPSVTKSWKRSFSKRRSR